MASVPKGAPFTWMMTRRKSISSRPTTSSPSRKAISTTTHPPLPADPPPHLPPVGVRHHPARDRRSPGGTSRPLAGAPNPVLKGRSQRPIERIHVNLTPQCRQARDPMLADAAGDNASKMRQIWCHIDAEAVRAHPAPQPDANGGNLVLPQCIPLWVRHPDAD